MEAGTPHHDAATEDALRDTIQRLQTDGILTDAEAALWRTALPETMRQSAYVLRHLTAHWTIGAVFAFDIVPLPLGTISRVCWTVGSRLIETFRGRWDHAAVHSVPVMAVAAIPVAGYFAYLIPLRARSAEAVFLYANHFTYKRYQCSWDSYVSRRSKWMARLLKGLVAIPTVALPATPSPETNSPEQSATETAGDGVASL